MSDVLADRYELRELLGSGGMAQVLEGYDRLLDRRVAVKILRDDLAGDPTLPQRFLREARTAARFSHPNAVTVFDTGIQGRRPYIVMELIEGRTLAEELAERGQLPAGEAIAIAEQTLDALAAAHELGFVHRDVKPGNIMLLDGGGVKLTDFGIAKELRDAQAGLTATGTVMGTPRYLAPEQVGGEPAVPASDVYAMGVVLYEMLAGAPPFDGDNAIAVALAHQRDPVPPLHRRRRDLDAGLVAVVERALAKDPADRYVDAGAMRSALLDLPGAVRPLGAADATTVALQRPDDPTRVLEQPPPTAAPPRRGGRTALVALLLVLLLAAAVFAATRGGDQEPPPVDPTPTPTAPAEDGADPDDGGAEPPAADPGADDAPADSDPADPGARPPAAPPATAPPAGDGGDSSGDSGDDSGQGGDSGGGASSGEGGGDQGGGQDGGQGGQDQGAADQDPADQDAAQGVGPDGEGPPGQRDS